MSIYKGKEVKLGAAALLAAASGLGLAAPAAADPIADSTQTKASAVRATNLNAKGSETQLRSQIATLQRTDPVKSAILRSALDQAKGRPGFNPAAISIVFGLKW